MTLLLGQVDGDVFTSFGTVVANSHVCPVCRRRPILVGEATCWPCRDEALDRFSDEGEVDQ